MKVQQFGNFDRSKSKISVFRPAMTHNHNKDLLQLSMLFKGMRRPILCVVVLHISK